jgi:exodeoxyribonuclease-3
MCNQKEITIINHNIGGIKEQANFLYTYELIKTIQADVYCFQETKRSAKDTKKAMSHQKAYSTIAVENTLNKKQNGCAVLYKQQPLNISTVAPCNMANEGRIITCEFDMFILINIYLPNNGTSGNFKEDKNKWFNWLLLIADWLEKEKPVIISGDMNIGTYYSDKATKITSAGFSVAERKMLEKLKNRGYTDALEKFYPTSGEMEKYLNGKPNDYKDFKTGWRLDYIFVSNSILKNVVSADLLIDKDRNYGKSWHVPIQAVLKF